MLIQCVQLHIQINRDQRSATYKSIGPFFHSYNHHPYYIVTKRGSGGSVNLENILLK